jgi:hypothetical protein
MQGDGNLVVYDAYGIPWFASNTSSTNGARLVVDTDGAIRIRERDGTYLWVRP